MQESAASMDQLGLPGQTPTRAGTPWAAPNAPAPGGGVVNWDDLK
jgi:hypothetical protein